jgi:UDP-2,3-diacylglucosamine pyrophosphatase LpxH
LPAADREAFESTCGPRQDAGTSLNRHGPSLRLRPDSRGGHDMRETADSLKCRAVFLSDIHLGTRACRAEALLTFLRNLQCDTIYLLGDIVDGWKLKSGWRWLRSHNEVVHELLRRSRAGVKLVYVPGNHDDRLRAFCGVHFGGVEVTLEAVHVGADGRRWLVTHGDVVDDGHGGVSAFIGDWGYRLVLWIDGGVHRMRSRLKRSPWSFSAWVKARTPPVRAHIDQFERAAAHEARRRGLQGVICGHIHQAAMREIDGVAYVNDGDWVESCTAAIEHADGRIEVVRWTAVQAAEQRGIAPELQALTA